MAKYTELYIDYLLNGGQNPAIFANIENFENRFIEKYADSEIGFETPDLFSLKLNLKAEIIIPVYKQKIDICNSLLEKYKELKGRETTDKLSNEKSTNSVYGEINANNTGKFNNGAIQTKNWELPTVTNINEIDPQGISETGSVENTSENISKQNEHTDKFNEIISQTNSHIENLTPNELKEQIIFVLTQKSNLMNDCLNEFNSLFMQVW